MIIMRKPSPSLPHPRTGLLRYYNSGQKRPKHTVDVNVNKPPPPSTPPTLNPQPLSPEIGVLRSCHSGQKMLKYIADVIVNGPDSSLGAIGGEPAPLDPTIPSLDPMVDMPQKTEPSLRDVYVKVGCLGGGGRWFVCGRFFFCWNGFGWKKRRFFVCAFCVFCVFYVYWVCVFVVCLCVSFWTFLYLLGAPIVPSLVLVVDTTPQKTEPILRDVYVEVGRLPPFCCNVFGRKKRLNALLCVFFVCVFVAFVLCAFFVCAFRFGVFGWCHPRLRADSWRAAGEGIRQGGVCAAAALSVCNPTDVHEMICYVTVALINPFRIPKIVPF